MPSRLSIVIDFSGDIELSRIKAIVHAAKAEAQTKYNNVKVVKAHAEHLHEDDGPIDILNEQV